MSTNPQTSIRSSEFTMPNRTKGEIRRSQLITTYGVGAIVAVEDESFMIAGIDRWSVGGPNLHEPRLERRLHVTGFVLPPATEDRDDIPVVRFPTWVHCPSCKSLQAHQRFTSTFKNSCNTCGVGLIPSRFVLCCPKGHIDDFPYFGWVHAGSPPAGDKHEMTIDTGGKTASLGDIRIECTCGKDATLEGAFQRNAMGGVSKCSGRRPWLTTNDPDCDQVPRVLQRGASNVWFAVTHSAISIPPWSEGAFKVLNKGWEILRHMPEEALAPTIEGMQLAEGTPYSVSDLVNAVLQRRRGESDTDAPTDTGLRRDEYQALVNGRPEETRDQDFVCTPADDPTAGITRWFSDVMVVKRLREVRALQSFARVVPSATQGHDDQPPLADTSPGWLPAIEVRGEGVFFDVHSAVLKEWEERAPVRARVEILDLHYRGRFEQFGGHPDRVITPRLVMIHTLAHAMITQWSLDCGYPAASLRERLYVDDEMAGFLILTATSDSAGSLGGLVGQADPDRLEVTLIEALTRCSWCSADPLCIEASAAGVDGLNLAACHACSLLPEVSCEEMNVLLDRALLIGTPDRPELGFFSEMLST